MRLEHRSDEDRSIRVHERREETREDRRQIRQVYFLLTATQYEKFSTLHTVLLRIIDPDLTS